MMNDSTNFHISIKRGDSNIIFYRPQAMKWRPPTTWRSYCRKRVPGPPRAMSRGRSGTTAWEVPPNRSTNLNLKQHPTSRIFQNQLLDFWSNCIHLFYPILKEAIYFLIYINRHFFWHQPQLTIQTTGWTCRDRSLSAAPRGGPGLRRGPAAGLSRSAGSLAERRAGAPVQLGRCVVNWFVLTSMFHGFWRLKWQKHKLCDIVVVFFFFQLVNGFEAVFCWSGM